MPPVPKRDRVGEAAAGAGSRLGAAVLRRREGATVLGYHAFAPAGAPGGGLRIAVDRFAEQMEHLRRHHDVVPLSSLLADLEAGRAPAAGTVCVTIDDGTADVALAASVLAALGLPWSLFVVTDFLDGVAPLWWERVEDPEALKAAPDADRRAAVSAAPAPPDASAPLTWAQLRTWRAAGVEIGSHTASHPILSRCDDATLDADLGRAHARLEEELGSPPTLFAVPNGLPEDTDERVPGRLRGLGYRGALSTVAGVVRADADPLWLPRTVIDGALSLDRFRLLAAGAGALRAGRGG